jgi:hypothetical protein
MAVQAEISIGREIIISAALDDRPRARARFMQTEKRIADPDHVPNARCTLISLMPGSVLKSVMAATR